MKKELQELIAARKSQMTISSEGVITEKTEGELTTAVVDALSSKTGFDWSDKALNDTVKVLSENTNAVIGAAAELSAQGFKDNADVDVNKLDASFGSQLAVTAAFARSKTYPTRDMATGEVTGEVTNYNVMSNGALVVKGAATKMMRDHAKSFGKDLLGE